MTFAEFQATRRYTDDFKRDVDCWQFDESGRGNVYLDGSLYIEENHHPYEGRWNLTIANWWKTSDDLEDLERELYKFAVGEGMIAGGGLSQ